MEIGGGLQEIRQKEKIGRERR